MTDGKEKIEEVAAKAKEPTESAKITASETSRAFRTRWVRTCVNKSLALLEEKELASRPSAADKTPWRRTRRK